MKILFVSGELIGSAICHELLRDGHEVKLYIESDGWKDCLDGIIPKTSSWKDELDWVGKDGLIIFDDICFGSSQDELRKKGYRVIGGSLLADKLEEDRTFFQDVLKEYGIKTLPSYDFTNSNEAIEFIKKNPGQWVVKQNTHFGALNYVGETDGGSDIIAVLKNYKAHGMSAHIQKKAVGIEVGVARYFNGQDWIGPIEINHEHKRLCNDDIGPLTPEMGTVMWFSHDESLPLFEKTLAKIKPFLQKANFKGDFDINCIVDQENIWPLEATARFGVPSTELQSEMMHSSWSELLSALADGTEYDPQFSRNYGVAVCIAVPPFPYTKDASDKSVFSSEILQLFFKDTLTEDEKKHIYLEEVSKKTNETGEEYFYWSGTNGWVMHITGEGESIEEARNKVYKLIEKIILPKKMYRTDIGSRVMNNDLPKLKEWGWV